MLTYLRYSNCYHLPRVMLTGQQCFILITAYCKLITIFHYAKPQNHI